jgi:hypothetical protein
MKCDTQPNACNPCRSKGLRCFTTDRVTGQARERGQSDRTESELMYLRDQLRRYSTRYGPLNSDDPVQRRLSEQSSSQIPSSRYLGWPAPEHIDPLCKGPINGTMVDIMDGVVDVADFACDAMDEPPRGASVFNDSRTSFVSTVFGYQRIEDPGLPAKEEALQAIEQFLVIMTQYYPVLHRPSFMDLVNRFYDEPESVSVSERVQVLMALATVSQQKAVRNHTIYHETYEKAHQLLHFALGFYRDVYHDVSLKAMQALSLIVLYCRNLSKPGVTWSLSHQVLVRTIELQYHRDPDEIVLPPNERTVLAKELRKRVFHAVLGVCVTTGCRVGLPAPWQFQHMDIPLPLILKDTEISHDGLAAQRSGQCDYHPANHLSKQIPLLTELYNHILSVRRPAHEYLKTVDALNTKIMAWRQDWDETMRNEQPLHVNLHVATLLIDQWAAEYQLTLHHPACCTSKDPLVVEKHIDICYKAARRLLSTFHTLSGKYKGADFTWHSTGPFAMAFGITLHYFRRRVAQVTKEQFEAMCNEFKGWMSLVAYADLVMKTGNHLQRIFGPRAQAVENEYRRLLAEAPLSTPNNGGHVLNNTQQQPQIKTESGPQPQVNGRVLSNPGNSVSLNSFTPPSPAPAYGPPPPNANSAKAWSQTTSNVHYVQSPPVASTYSAYSQPAGAPLSQSPQIHSAPQFHQLPVSLAPILNNPQIAYTTYPNLSQAATLTTGAPVVDYTTMAFLPDHYYDHTGPVSWPLITMPPGQQ